MAWSLTMEQVDVVKRSPDDLRPHTSKCIIKICSPSKLQQYCLLWPGNYAENMFIDRSAKCTNINEILGCRFIFCLALPSPGWLAGGHSLAWLEYAKLCWWKNVRSASEWAELRKTCIYNLLLKKQVRMWQSLQFVCKAWKTTSSYNDNAQKRL